MQQGPEAPAIDPTRCGARTRAGKPCKRSPAKGRTRCKLHGGASTGPRTPEGKARSVEAVTHHGAFATSATYEAALRFKHPELFDSAGGSPDLARELAFARARLGALALQGKAVPADAVERAVDLVRRLAAAQAGMAPGLARAGDLPPGEMPRRFRLELTVVDPPALREDPMDAALEELGDQARPGSA